MFPANLDRRRFLYQAGMGALSAGLGAGCVGRPAGRGQKEEAAAEGPLPVIKRPADKERKVILIRFGGGVRRLETVQDPDKTYCPFLVHELAAKHGVLFNNLDIESKPGIDTSHGQGTLYLLTGQYRHYEDIEHQPFADRFVAQSPTIFEYLRAAFGIPEHQALIVNGEDRINEEFYTFSNHHLFGVDYRSTVLSLYGFKAYNLRRELEENTSMAEKEHTEKWKKLADMEKRDYRVKEAKHKVLCPEIAAFWERWGNYYGKSGLINPRGDRLLTTLSLRALKELRPRLLMINYQDPDYVHWGNPNFYTRAVSIIDEGIRAIYEATQHDEFYRDNTVFVVVPDCGRDNNRGMSVPFQHHFNTKSAHEIFAVIAGPKNILAPGAHPIARKQQQISVAATVGEIMGFPTPEVEAPSLLQVV
jgi:hypothetical protein